jgi:hypothetical protein
MYNDLLDNQWHMNDIDGMDVIGFLRLRAWKAGRGKKERAPKRAYIDEVWGSGRP